MGGLTVQYTGKNAFNATVKDSINVYIVNSSIAGIEEGENVASRNLKIALSKSGEAKSAASKKGAAKKKKELMAENLQASTNAEWKLINSS